MGTDELLRRIATTLEELDVPYLVTGSMATMLYGEPRFTNDIDVVVRLTPELVSAFCSAFPDDEFYLDEKRVEQAVARRSQFNIIHPRSGLKVDVMIAEDSAFERSRFARARREHPAPEFSASFASPEDAILKKLQFYRDGGSEKHVRDIVAVLEISGDEIDRAYIEQWVDRLDVREVWEAILKRQK